MSEARVDELLKLVGLPGSEKKYPAQLSGGQQQRIALARALATSPGLLLLDEPLSALDAIVRVHLRQEIRALQRQLGVTTIMVTHDQEEALSVADRIVVMNHGVIEQVGTPLQVYRDPASPFVADFVGRINALPGTLAGGDRVRFGSEAFDCLHEGKAGREVTIYLRPEDVLARPIAPGDANVFDARIDKIEFLGSYCLVRSQCRGAEPPAAERHAVAEFPGRAAARGGQTAAAAAVARTHAHLLTWPLPEAPSALPPRGAPPAARQSRFRGGRSLGRPVWPQRWRCEIQRSIRSREFGHPAHRAAAPSQAAHALDRAHRACRAAGGGAGAAGLPGRAAGQHPAEVAAGQQTTSASGCATSSPTRARRRCSIRCGTACGCRRWSR